MPRRPTKKWWTACVAGVEESGGAIDPKRVCGKVWSRKSAAERKAIARADERGRRRKRGNYTVKNFDEVAADVGRVSRATDLERMRVGDSRVIYGKSVRRLAKDVFTVDGAAMSKDKALLKLVSAGRGF